ncbi:MAG: hypothetical protein JNL87_11550 [Burkholderiaceae bacterium]|nr:hypothetical protein [Burkholderiaceae bacterium]
MAVQSVPHRQAAGLAEIGLRSRPWRRKDASLEWPPRQLEQRMMQALLTGRIRLA